MNNKLIINKKIISENKKPYIVAELSANHNGSIKNALNHIKLAKKKWSRCNQIANLYTRFNYNK